MLGATTLTYTNGFAREAPAAKTRIRRVVKMRIRVIVVPAADSMRALSIAGVRTMVFRLHWLQRLAHCHWGCACQTVGVPVQHDCRRITPLIVLHIKGVGGTYRHVADAKPESLSISVATKGTRCLITFAIWQGRTVMMYYTLIEGSSRRGEHTGEHDVIYAKCFSPKMTCLPLQKRCCDSNRRHQVL